MLPTYAVTPRGKMGLYLGDQLLHEHDVPKQWELDAARARQRGDPAEAKRLVEEQTTKSMDMLLARFFGAI